MPKEELFQMKVAIVHDWLNQRGGAENVLEALLEMFPKAPIYTSIYWPNKMPEAYRSWDIRTSFMDRLPIIRKHHQPFLPLYPLAFEQFDLRDYDVVISNKSAFCHGVITGADTLHICYCLTPTRFLWDYISYIQREELSRIVCWALPPFLNYLRLWDKAAADRVDHFIAISQAVRQRIKKYYGRESVVIYPPVNTAHYNFTEGANDYFLIVSRLIPYKRIDLAVNAFNQLKLPLVIVGEGRDMIRLQAIAKSNIKFLGRVPDDELRRILASCRAFIFPGLEDFGIAPVEAQAAGRPVIAYAGGGAVDTIIEGVTGTFFHEQTPQALADAVRSFDDTLYDPAVIRNHAMKFDIEVFKKKLIQFIEEKWYDLK